MRKMIFILAFASSPTVLAQRGADMGHSEMNAGLAKMCYGEAATQASIALSLAFDQVPKVDEPEVKKLRHQLRAEEEVLLITETACAENTFSEDEKNECIRENYVTAASALIKGFGLDHLKSDAICALVIP